MKRIKKVLLLLFVLGGVVFGQIFPQASLAVTKSLYIAEAKQSNFTPILKIDPDFVDSTVSNYMYAALGYLAVTNMNVVGYIKDIRTFVVYYVEVRHDREMLAFMSPTGERTYVAQAGNNGTIISDSYFIRPMPTFIISFSYLKNILAAEQIYMLGVNKAIKIKIDKSLLSNVDRSKYTNN